MWESKKTNKKTTPIVALKESKEVTGRDFKGGFAGNQTLDQRYTLSLSESEAIY